ncbi:uncharacterized protein EAF01_008772 [Botrytis porri]|uniref:uncharacterized protein n=1 Tax=Botrytis porri TaxID=87229 RepID=UPI001902A442|nr:uncharacterized protein EAF01_008772 [Botrytis porri]KAF7897806.1 hypothetical protein EAF01_008772 [Botrytis porri]
MQQKYLPLSFPNQNMDPTPGATENWWWRRRCKIPAVVRLYKGFGGTKIELSRNCLQTLNATKNADVQQMRSVDVDGESRCGGFNARRWLRGAWSLGATNVEKRSEDVVVNLGTVGIM